MKAGIVWISMVVMVVVLMMFLPVLANASAEDSCDAYGWWIIADGWTTSFGASDYEEGWHRRLFDSAYINIGIGEQGRLSKLFYSPMTSRYQVEIYIWAGPMAERGFWIDWTMFRWNTARQHYRGPMPEGINVSMTLYSPEGLSQALDPLDGYMTLPIAPSTWDKGYKILVDVDATNWVASKTVVTPEPGGLTVLSSGLIGAACVCLRRRRPR